MKTEKCPFCNLSSDVEIIYESELVIAFYDKFPVNVGHALIIPKRHVANYFDLTPEEISEMQDVLFRVKDIVKERHNPDGFNISVNVGEHAGQSVFHVHMHLIPRFKGDVEDPKGGIRGVIPSKQKY